MSDLTPAAEVLMDKAFDTLMRLSLILESGHPEKQMSIAKALEQFIVPILEDRRPHAQCVQRLVVDYRPESNQMHLFNQVKQSIDVVDTMTANPLDLAVYNYNMIDPARDFVPVMVDLDEASGQLVQVHEETRHVPRLVDCHFIAIHSSGKEIIVGIDKIRRSIPWAYMSEEIKERTRTRSFFSKQMIRAVVLSDTLLFARTTPVFTGTFVRVGHSLHRFVIQEDVDNAPLVVQPWSFPMLHMGEMYHTISTEQNIEGRCAFSLVYLNKWRINRDDISLISRPQ